MTTRYSMTVFGTFTHVYKIKVMTPTYNMSVFDTYSHVYKIKVMTTTYNMTVLVFHVSIIICSSCVAIY